MQLVVGRVGRAHGVRGDLFVEVRTDEPEVRFAPGSSVRVSGGPDLIVESAKVHAGRLVVHFAGYNDRTTAEELRNKDLVVEVDPDVLPDDEDEFYDHQLEGLEAFLEDGTLVGEVFEVIHLPAQDLLAIKRTDGSETLVPFVTEFVPEIDLATNRILLTPPPGLLNEEEAIIVRDEESPA